VAGQSPDVLLDSFTYGRWISDPPTAYKLYPTHLVREMRVQSSGFEADHEMTAKLLRRTSRLSRFLSVTIPAPPPKAKRSGRLMG